MEKLFYFFDSAVIFFQSDCFVLDIISLEMTAFTGYNLSFSFYIADGGYIRKGFWCFSDEKLKNLSVGFIWLLLAEDVYIYSVYKHSYTEGVFKLRLIV